VKLDKGDFIGKDALTNRQANGPLRIDTHQAPARGGASLMLGDRVPGTVTSAAWGYRVGMNLAYAFVDPAHADIGTVAQLDIYGDLVDAEVIPASPHDPGLDRMQG
jgi:dimethylglycine dehydrogenase